MICGIVNEKTHACTHTIPKNATSDRTPLPKATIEPILFMRICISISRFADSRRQLETIACSPSMGRELDHNSCSTRENVWHAASENPPARVNQERSSNVFFCHFLHIPFKDPTKRVPSVAK